MNTDLMNQAAALEAEIEGLFATLAAEAARTQELNGRIKAMEMDLSEAWDSYEKRFPWAFGERGLYPEIPHRWYPVIFRLVERLDAALSEEFKREFEFTQIKEKFGGLRVYYNSDWTADSIIDTLIEQAEAEVETIEKLHKKLS
ncbi:hypothetical protein [Azospirillum brasilense]|uniref:hypothetical protein n=1 Tax=Azospirillum brasilense TaxID=192 RepID=UPI000E6A1BE2|nr:hypothetical protein [Azospirillum brasilense]NUB23332.1 hypothetical protein [Azospirillum brasilense]NUB30954.1 hypothetical protein [Azospirillum brasilense]RIW05663.1 hypothetical protein D2T81_07405 [Azospirillum brasilense]